MVNTIYLLLSVIFCQRMCLRGRSLLGTFSGGTSPRFHQQTDATLSQELSPGEGRTKIIEDDPRSYTPEYKQSTAGGSAKFLTSPSKRSWRTKKDQGSPKVIHPSRTLPQTRDRSRQTRPSKPVTPGHRKSVRSNLDLNCFPAYSTLNKRFTVTAALSCKVQDNCSQ